MWYITLYENGDQNAGVAHRGFAGRLAAVRENLSDHRAVIDTGGYDSEEVNSRNLIGEL